MNQCVWSKLIPPPQVTRYMTQRWLPQSWLQRAETEQSMAEQDIEGVTLGRSSPPEEV